MEVQRKVGAAQSDRSGARMREETGWARAQDLEFRESSLWQFGRWRNPKCPGAEMRGISEHCGCPPIKPEWQTRGGEDNRAVMVEST